MTRYRCFSVFLVRAVLPLVSALAMPAFADELVSISIENAWLRAVPPVSTTTAAYFTATNNSDGAMHITGVSTAIAGDTPVICIAPSLLFVAVK